MQSTQSREYLFDNLKALLIFLVVFGHAIELILWRRPSIAYSFIYLFHMPLFIFCSGYFASYRPKKILTRLIGTYVIFQVLYLLFDHFVLSVYYYDFLIQFSTPYWIMWYLFALIVWTLLVPLLDVLTNTRKNTILTICGAVLLGVVSGFDDTLGYYMSLARIVYFFPFFVAGFCVKKAFSAEAVSRALSKWYVRCAAGLLTALILLWLFFYNYTVDIRWFWGAFSYERIAYFGYSHTVRILIYLAGAVISLFLLSVLPRRRMFFSYIGTRTMSIFLLHGFVIRLLGHHSVLSFIPDGFVTNLFLVAISIVMVGVFSSPLFQLTDGGVLPALWKRLRRSRSDQARSGVTL